MERYTKNGAFKERCNGNIPYAEIVSFVSKVEDIMEGLGIETVKQLDELIDAHFGIESAQITKILELRQHIAEMEANKEKEINRICKTHIETNERLKQQLTETKEELVNCDNARNDWKNRAMTYAELIVSLNDILPNKQEQEITFAKVIEDVKKLIAQKDDELKARKELCDLRYNQIKQATQEIDVAIQQLKETKHKMRNEFIEELVDMVGDYWEMVGGKISLSGADFEEIIERMRNGEE